MHSYWSTCIIDLQKILTAKIVRDAKLRKLIAVEIKGFARYNVLFYAEALIGGTVIRI